MSIALLVSRPVNIASLFVGLLFVFFFVAGCHFCFSNALTRRLVWPGVKREAIVKSNFWEVFGLSDCEEVPEAVKETALLGREFTITNVRIRDGITVELSDSAVQSVGANPLFTMGFR